MFSKSGFSALLSIIRSGEYGGLKYMSTPTTSFISPLNHFLYNSLLSLLIKLSNFTSIYTSL